MTTIRTKIHFKQCRSWKVWSYAHRYTAIYKYDINIFINLCLQTLYFIRNRLMKRRQFAKCLVKTYFWALKQLIVSLQHSNDILVKGWNNNIFNQNAIKMRITTTNVDEMLCETKFGDLYYFLRNLYYFNSIVIMNFKMFLSNLYCVIHISFFKRSLAITLFFLCYF